MREINFYKSNKTLVLSLVLIVVNGSLFAQKDTLYFLSNWKSTVKDSAVFFRPPVKKEGDLFRVQDYYMSGQLQMNALSISSEKDIWEGKVVWYNKDGSVFQQGDYKNNRLEGDFITYMDGKKMISKYQNGRFKSGVRNVTYGNRQMYFEQKGDTLFEVLYEKDIKGIREEHFGTKDSYRFLSKYYNNEGVLIGERKLLKNGYYKGVEVFYYTNPMQVKTINYHPFGQLLISETYYTNGQIREKVKKEPVWSKTFYNQDGKELAKVTYRIDQDRLKPVSGTELFFAYGSKGSRTDILRTSRTYENGVIVKDELYHDNGQLSGITDYVDGSKVLQVSYDESGKEIARMLYKNYRPFDGTEILTGRTSIYKSGELVKETIFYLNSELPKVTKTKTSETYFDKNGKTLGTLYLEDDNGYTKPKEGKRYSLDYKDGYVNGIDEYKNGVQVKRTSYRKRKVGKDSSKTFKRTVEYDDEGYTKTKETIFYSNGSKQSEIEYKKYKQTFGKFYDENEMLIGSYDYEKKDGIFYKFFGDSDEIELMEEVKEGKTQRLKSYNYGKSTEYGQINPVLERDIDIDCCATYYSPEGELIAKLTFKNQLPWEGVAYDHTGKTKHTIKKGKRNGMYQKLDYNQKILEEGQYAANKREGVFKYYDYQGNLKQIENYTLDKLNGKTVYYDESGKVTSEMDYKNGLPLNGTKILNLYASEKQNQETYKNGLLVESIFYDINGKRVTKYTKAKESQVTAYFKDSNKKRLSYTISNSTLNGEVIRYDSDGKEKHRGVFENGKFQSGTIFITPRYDDKNTLYIEVSKQNEVLVTKYISFDNEVIFKAEEKLIVGSIVSYIKKLNLNLDYLSERDLY